MFFDKILIIVRHGNTFRPDEEPRRIGSRTDLPLVEETRSITAARIIKSRGLFPARVFAAPLLRTMQTAELIVNELGLNCTIQQIPEFTEIDYGPDENQTENNVIKRLGTFYLGRHADLNEIIQRGKDEIDNWNNNAAAPACWNVDTTKIIADWRNFTDKINKGETVLVVSSNGIIRFAPHILLPDDFEIFRNTHNLRQFVKTTSAETQYQEKTKPNSTANLNNLKVTTAGICIFVQKNNKWNITDWNIKPDLNFKIADNQKSSL
ncbi:MAG: histidine phosphatase family protein [Planctomycetaceae bacterium]|jgi:probable phosphoglycerate mutase|nr:histidine phosphatase family protein [Planctomycetaceae bacterium]